MNANIDFLQPSCGSKANVSHVMSKMEENPLIMTIDCCEHIHTALKCLLDSLAILITPTESAPLTIDSCRTKLIVIGVSRYPERRVFVTELQRIYPSLPMLILRHNVCADGHEIESIRGEFVLSDYPINNDLEIVRSLRNLFPLKVCCAYMGKGVHYEQVREVTRILAENYADPNLDLDYVAKNLPISPSHLSRILNKQVGISFPQMLRLIRIEAAMGMLTSGQFSIKEVATRVGFSDSHYFSRSFKELTGISATAYRSKAPQPRNIQLSENVAPQKKQITPAEYQLSTSC